MKLVCLSLSRIGGVLATLGFLANTTGAATLYSQPLNNSLFTFYSNEGQLVVADLFKLSSGGTINQVSWFGFGAASNTFSPFTINIYAYSGGNPGTILDSVTNITASLTDTGVTNGGHPVYQFSSALSSPFTASAGTNYFISVIEQTTSNNFEWSGSANEFGGFDKLSGNPFWAELSNDQAFTLSSSDISTVPLPGALPLLATGLGALGLLGWRRKCKFKQL